MSENITKQVLNLPLSQVFANPDQPRKHFDETKLQELAMSIAEYGVQEPIKVVPREDRYMIIMGERRFRASRLAGKETVPSIVEHYTPEEVEELALLENIQREDLSVIEEARAFQSLLDRGMSKEELARKMGLKQIWRIDERTSLLNLSEDIQKMVTNNNLTNSQAFEVSRLPQVKQQQVVNKILRGELNSYNKIRAFVNAMIELESQGAFFQLEQMSQPEKETIDTFNSMLRNVERFIKQVYERDKVNYLKKAGFRQDIQPERLDLVIQQLQKVRKEVLAGKGLKEALVA